MITKFILFETHKDVDPYGEEEWDEKYKIGQSLIPTTNLYSNQDKLIFAKGQSYKILNVLDDHIILENDKKMPTKIMILTAINYFTKKLNENHKDVDPYGEEDWGESSSEMERLWNIILEYEFFTNKEFNREDNSIEFDCYYPRRGRLEFLIEEIEGEITMSVMRYDQDYSVVLTDFTPLYFWNAFADLSDKIKPIE